MWTAELCRKHGMSSASLYAWKAKFGGMDVSDAQKLKGLEAENAKLNAKEAETWDRILFERKLGDDKAAKVKEQAREAQARCAATHGHALHTVGELRAMARRGAKTVRLATILDLDEGDQP